MTLTERAVAGLIAAMIGAALNLVPAQAINSTTPIARPACALNASCKFTVKRAAADFPTHGDMALLNVSNGPNNTDTAKIDYDIYRPVEPDGTTTLPPQPAVMYFNGFGGAKDDSSGVAIANYLTGHGYVVLTFSSEGFGNSTGKIQLDAPEFDVKNAEALVDVLKNTGYVALKDNGDPIVGTTGGSYGGAIQILLAQFDRRIDAITPFRTWNTLEYSLVPNNLQSSTAFQPQTLPCCGVAKFEWTSLFFVSGLTQPLTGHGNGISGSAKDPGNPCPGYPTQLCAIYLQSAAQGSGVSAKALLNKSSPATYFAPNVASGDTTQLSIPFTAPTLLGQGEADTLFNVNDSVANYSAIKALGVPVKMIWHSNGHGYDDQPGEGDVFGNDQTDPGSKYLPPRILAWFDRYLRLDTTVDTGPDFSYFQDWVQYPTSGSAAPAYGSAPGFPAQSSATFSLSGTADLVGPGSTVAAGSALVLSPAKGQPGAYTETSNEQCPGCTLPDGSASPVSGQQPTNIPGEFADFTSQPLLRDVVSVGIPTAHLHISSVTNPDVILFGKVWDVDSAGNATLIKRMIAPVRVFNVNQAVDMNLVGFAHKFLTGHRVRFEVASTDLTSTSDHVASDTIHIIQNAAPGPTSMLDKLVGAFSTRAVAASDTSTFTLPVDGPAGAIVPPGNGQITGGTPNTATAAPLSPYLGATLLGLALILGVRLRRRLRRG